MTAPDRTTMPVTDTAPVVMSRVDAVVSQVLSQPLPARHRLTVGMAARCDLHAVERAVDRVMPLDRYVLSDRIRLRGEAMNRLAVSRPSRVHVARHRALDLRRERRRRGRWSG